MLGESGSGNERNPARAEAAVARRSDANLRERQGVLGRDVLALDDEEL